MARSMSTPTLPRLCSAWAAVRTDSTVRDPRVVEILSLIAGDRGPDAALPLRLCAECLSALPISGVGVALMTADGPSGAVLAATDGRARQLEELQFSLGEGPCVEASRSG